MRNAIIRRNTGETQICVSLEIDGKGKADLGDGTGIGFFDHMLNAFPATDSLISRFRQRAIWRWTAIIWWKTPA